MKDSEFIREIISGMQYTAEPLIGDEIKHLGLIAKKIAKLENLTFRHCHASTHNQMISNWRNFTEYTIWDQALKL